MVYIANAVPEGGGLANLEPLGKAGEAAHLALGVLGSSATLTTATVNNQGLVDLIQAAVTGLEPKRTYFLATSLKADGSGLLTPLAKFMSNPAGAAIVDAVGALRAATSGAGDLPRQYLVIASEQDGKPLLAVQVSR